MASKQNAKDDSVITLTQDSYDELKAELEKRKNEEREKIANEIAAARELGDLSENYPYVVAMQKKEMNENRIAELEVMLKDAKVVQTSNSTSVVTIGAKVQIKNLKTNSSRKVVLAGSEETQTADPSEGKISVDSPIGRAIFKAKSGETVEVETPAGNTQYKIEKIF